ncbi:MAG: Gfo/Idh/MocA family oxidoreductase [Caldilineaceae bacterium]|nr:Gfo/Idh/MocA family oxidoreductase [Caldilineaceae bacterium]
MPPLRMAIIGCGGFARRHARVFTELPDYFQLVAFCDRNHDRAARFSQDFTQGAAAVFTDHPTLLAQARLDAVAICVPPYGHTDQVACAAQHGVHVFIEKPIALTMEQAWSMVEAAEAAGIVTQVGFMLRFGSAVERLKQIIESGEAGQAGLMSARYFCNDLHAGWWRSRDRSGGQLVEQVIHMIDLMRYLMGEAESVYSIQRNLFHKNVPDYTIEDVSGTTISFAQGGIGVLYATNNAIPGKWTNDYRVVAAHLTAEFSDANHAAFVYTSDPALPRETVASDESVYRREMMDFYHAIRENRPARTPIREGARSLALALAATQSAQTNQVVFLSR